MMMLDKSKGNQEITSFQILTSIYFSILQGILYCPFFSKKV